MSVYIVCFSINNKQLGFDCIKRNDTNGKRYNPEALTSKLLKAKVKKSAPHTEAEQSPDETKLRR